jgi:uncharacterized membrane protein YccF (DUF307 family)
VNDATSYPPPSPPGAPGSAVRVIGNILWLILSGLWMAMGYAVAGLLMFVTIIGIPFGIQAFKLAGFSLWPFGRMMVRKTGQEPARSWATFCGSSSPASG